MAYIKTNDSQRIFIGVPLDERAQHGIDALLDPWRSAYRNFRWVPAANRHLTLAFLGNIPAAEIESLAPEFDTAYDGQYRFSYRFSKLRRFPNTRGGIVALTGEASAPLQALFTRTRNLLNNLALPFDDRKPRPHVTLARIGKAHRAGIVIDEPAGIRLDVTRVALYRSTLTGSGSIYHILQQAVLP